MLFTHRSPARPGAPAAPCQIDASSQRDPGLSAAAMSSSDITRNAWPTKKIAELGQVANRLRAAASATFARGLIRAIRRQRLGPVASKLPAQLALRRSD